MPTRDEVHVEEAIGRDSEMLPLQFPNDSSNRAFPVLLLRYNINCQTEKTFIVIASLEQKQKSIILLSLSALTQSTTVNRSLLALLTDYSSGKSYMLRFPNIKKA